MLILTSVVFDGVVAHGRLPYAWRYIAQVLRWSLCLALSGWPLLSTLSLSFFEVARMFHGTRQRRQQITANKVVETKIEEGGGTPSS